MVSTSYYIALLLIFLRMVTFTALVPIFFPKGTPAIMKAFFSAVIAMIIVPSIDVTAVNSIDSNFSIYFFMINEVITGLFLGAITNICFLVFSMAGQMIDIQIGLSMATMFDPNSETSTTLIQRLMYWVSFIVFLLIDGHHMLIKALVQSFKIVGIGKTIIFNETIMAGINAITSYFALGLKIAIPIVFIILLTDITMGLVSRTVPQLNIMILGLPVKILIGFLSVSLAIPIFINFMINAFNNIPQIYNDIFKAIPGILIFASEDKTEEATPKKKSDARKKGQLARSKDIGLSFTLLACTLVISIVGPYVGKSFKAILIYFFTQNFKDNMSFVKLSQVSLMFIYEMAMIFLPIVLPIMLMGIVSSFAQTGFLFTGEPIKPSFSKINPLSGLKRIFSPKTLVETLKQIVIITVVGYIGYGYVKDNYNDIMNMGNMSISEIPIQFSKIVIGIFIKITIASIIIAVVDFIYQKYNYRKDLRMTKQEIKEEFKQSEGDPQIKGKIKQKQREISRRRMMAAVPDATVVITNPTHIAVALKYDDKESEAPILVAKGTDITALKIKEIAKENEVPIIENKPLARMIYEEVELDSQIPVNMYQAVAEILAVVFKMKKKSNHK
ncbi:fused FliR family export protein/FlhB family type III secretion system protein [Clostridium sp. 19966]|uniref:fused FliR family export protein/FlhB family type III secretion system protein n=1 Tax=Clostridium sp. 19966 TaxID=2768166 RepID=UPI0028DE2986|nr:fused FliR family export protein/FlhB family type III secretion system protein [Clostridium sp. 19966]MDT8716643.1 fused FliR family export protein/FlhB family type III secretion system protein [Clostridium sp. 19966]